MTILINAAFRDAALIRGEVLIRGKHLFQYGYPKMWRLLEGGAYFNMVTKICGAYQREAFI